MSLLRCVLMVGVFIALAECSALANDDAQARSAAELSHQRFEAGRLFFEQGRYADAVREFEAGYSLVPKPQFLLNLGQAHRMLGNLTRARSYYQRYLDATPADEPERDQAVAILAWLDRALAHQEPVLSQASAPSVVAPPVAVVAAAPAKKPARHRRAVLWIAPLVGAVVAGAAIGLGVYFGTRHQPVSCTDPSLLGCVTVP